MTDPVVPDDGHRLHESRRVADNADNVDIADNVFELRRRESTGAALGHPSGPRSAAVAGLSAATGVTASTPVDAALASLRVTAPSGDVLRQVRLVRPDPSTRLRVALATLSMVQLAMAAAWLLGKVPFGQIIGNPTAAHLSRDAALGVVLGSIGSIVAWRPRWSLSLIPIVGAIVAVQAIGLVADGSNEQVGFHFEFPHVVAIVVGALIFVASRRRQTFVGT